VTVPIVTDATDEPSETFTVTLSAPVNATGGPRNRGRHHHQRRQPAAAVSIADVTVTEGTGGTTNAPFVVTVASSTQTVTSTFCHRERLGDRWQRLHRGPRHGDLPAGSTTADRHGADRHRCDREPNETFTVTLSAPVNGRWPARPRSVRSSTTTSRRCRRCRSPT
jgi:hypothetical protein